MSSAALAGVPGDEAADAITIQLNETIEFNTNKYTPSGGFVNANAVCPGTFLNWNPTNSNNDIWFSFTPDEDMLCFFTTCSPGGYDTSMILYQGGTGNNNMVACNGDAAANSSCQEYHSEIAYEVTGGLEYLVRIGGYQAASGPAALSVFPDPCADSEPVTVEVSSVAEVVAAFDSGLCDGATIRLAPGTYNWTSTLVLQTDADVTFAGTVGKGGELLTTLDGGGVRQIFQTVATNMTFRDLRFQNARAGGDGGAIITGGMRLIANCEFDNNVSNLGGGAICLTGPQNTLLEDCVFTNNSAQFAGAVFHPQNSNTNPLSPTLRRCEFYDNTASGTGGAMASGGSSPTYDSCTFVGNVMQMTPPSGWNWSGGGAMHFNAGGSPTVINCRIEGNETQAGGQCGGAIWAGGGATVSYGDNVMCANTCGASISHISSSDGGSFVNLGGNVLEDECAPEPEPCPADLNGDGNVDSGDLGLLIAAWNTDDAVADINGDGNVDSGDLGLLISEWGPCEPKP